MLATRPRVLQMRFEARSGQVDRRFSSYDRLRQEIIAGSRSCPVMTSRTSTSITHSCYAAPTAFWMLDLFGELGHVRLNQILRQSTPRVAGNLFEGRPEDLPGQQIRMQDLVENPE